jgi:hypothetical protein
MTTLVGVLAQSIRDQEHGSAYAPVFHVGYPVLNALAIYYVLSQLGDETRSARTTIVVWSLGTLTLWVAYWSWVL